MKLQSCEKKENSTVEIIVEVSAEEFGAAVDAAYKKNRSQISVPGFRKGKAPRKIIEKMYGPSVFYEDALDNILPTVLSFSIKDTELKIISMPKLANIEFDDDGNAVFTIMTAVYPEVTLGEYKGLSAVKPVFEIPDSAIDSELAEDQARNARFETMNRPAAEGDIVTLDYEGFLDGVAFEGGKGEDYDLTLGSGTFIPGFEDQVLGMSAGESRDLNVVFPDNYKEELAGKPAVFKVTVKAVKEKHLPDIDDDLAKDVSKFDTLEEYKADIRKRLEDAKKDEADKAFENALMEKLVESMECEIPDEMVEEQMTTAMNRFLSQISAYGMEPESYYKMFGINEETFRESLRESSEGQVKVMLALEKIAKLEGFEVTDNEIESEYIEASVRFSVTPQEVKENISRDAIIHEINLRKAAKLVRENAIALDPPEEPEPDASKPEASKPEASEPDAGEEKPKKTRKPVAKKAKKTEEAPESEPVAAEETEG